MIYFWDMDSTLVDNDCDVSWKEFLVKKNIAPKSALQEADTFYQQYLNKSLDIDSFIQFQLFEFAQLSKQEIKLLCEEHFETVVKQKIFPQAEKIVKQQLKDSDTLCLITATNNYIAEPLANYLGIKYIKATKVEEDSQKFTGNFIPPYCYGENKIHYMLELINELDLPKDTPTTYYGDSINDIPIFKWVNQAFVVNPNEELRQQVKKHNWKELKFTRLNT